MSQSSLCGVLVQGYGAWKLGSALQASVFVTVTLWLGAQDNQRPPSTESRGKSDK